MLQPSHRWVREDHYPAVVSLLTGVHQVEPNAIARTIVMEAIIGIEVEAVPASVTAEEAVPSSNFEVASGSTVDRVEVLHTHFTVDQDSC